MREVYEIGECIGAGSFSTVHEAIHKTTGEKYVWDKDKYESMTMNILKRCAHQGGCNLLFMNLLSVFITSCILNLFE